LVGGGEIAIRLVEADEGQALNKEYRGKDYATNVLSFPYDIEPVVRVIWSSARRRGTRGSRAKQAAGSPLRPLVVHGMLHLQGWDHEMMTMPR
jgi:probable rRNA maturation factor